MNLLLAIDIGNTNTGYALYKNTSSNETYQRGNIPTKDILDGQEVFFLEFFKRLNLNLKPNIVLSSVVPDATDCIRGLLRDYSEKYLEIAPQSVDTIVHVGNINTGADRICAMAGAYSLYRTDLAVVDFGTATTVSVVDKDAKFISGAILPGVELMLKCLHHNTAQLPDVKIRGYEKVTTIDTELSILSGVITGTAGAIERIIKDIEKENGFVLQLILTGGMVDIMRDKISIRHDVNYMLVFEGMRNIFLRNL